MSYSLFADLTESKLIPSYWHINQFTAEQVGDIIYLYCMALHVLSEDPTTAQWAADYARKTISYGDFSQKSNFGTDLYVLLYALRSGAGFHDKVGSTNYLSKIKLDWYNVTVFLQDISRRISRNHRSFLLSLDSGLHISDPTIKSLRRSVMDWEVLPESDMRLALGRLAQKLRSVAPKSELLDRITSLANAV